MASPCEEIDLQTVFVENQEIFEILQTAGIGGLVSSKSAALRAHQYQAIEFLGSKGEFNRPWGVTVNASNDVIVTDMCNKCVKVYSIQERRLTLLFGQNLLENPTGVCTDEQGKIYVADKIKNTISIFSPDGSNLGVIGKNQNGNTRLTGPRGISLDSQGNIVVCSSKNKCIKVLSIDGMFLRTIGVGRLLEPFDCLCHKDVIYVSDRAGNAVKVFNYFSGNFLFDFGKEGREKGAIQRPTGLAIDRSGHLLVCLEETKRVQIYNLDGTYVTSFGESGCSLGQFSLPNNISVLMDGRIVVADFSNNRLQIFK